MTITSSMKAVAIAAFAMLAVSLAPSQGHAGQTSATGEYKVAQACGWFAIYTCHRSYGAAKRVANKRPGYVVNTNHYPNFRNGWYCVASGPTSRRKAKHMARKNRWWASTSYAKRSC